MEVSLTILPFVTPLAPGRVPRQRLSASFNGESIGPETSVTTAAQNVVKFIIPLDGWNKAAAGVDPLGTLKFEFPDAVSPASLDPVGHGQDDRHLGIHFYKVQLRVMS